MLPSSTKVLLVSATEMEMLPAESLNVDQLVAGIGMVATTHALTKTLMNGNYDLVVNMGIAGSFQNKFEIGSVLQVLSDRIVELGAEDNGSFIPADKMKLMKTEDVLFETEVRVQSLEVANGITVNRVHGSADSIRKIVAQFNPDVESMEGAALAYVCKQFGVPWVQIRAISNRVEPRNRDAWNIPLAIKNLHAAVLSYLETLQHEA
ncbi:MAG: futalosine hydrolase [Flavobacteriales bacterium]|nr:futalosine hydrolase [Flavobacteriales bacterium]